MGCAPCEARAAANATRAQGSQKVASPTGECQYTIEQVLAWLERVECVLKQAVYKQIPNITKKQVNSYVGTLLSAKNYANNICYFEKELDEIESFITILTLKNLCSN
jgi:hypothetical protein